VRAALAVAVALLTPVAQAPAPTPVPTSARAPRIAVEPAVFDFGKVLQERTLTKQFSIRNFGSADLAILGISHPCGCTAALMDSKVVKPGGSATVRVTFETRNYSGKVTRSVLVKSNDPQRQTVELKLEATVTPDKK
jgi:hypothetical protein